MQDLMVMLMPWQPPLIRRVESIKALHIPLFFDNFQIFRAAVFEEPNCKPSVMSLSELEPIRRPDFPISPPFSPTPEVVEEIMYVCQYKCLEMFPLPFQKLRFEELPAPSCVLRQYAGKANVFIQNWPFALT